MKSAWNPAVREELLARVGAVDENSKAEWGRFTPPKMLAHLCEAMKMPIGELAPKPRKLPLRYFPLKQLLIYVAPFPKGAPTSPELISSDVPLDVAKKEIRRLLDEFASRDIRASWPPHPAFGSLSGSQWGILMYRHANHHLRQFGC